MTISVSVGKGGPAPLPCVECTSFFLRANALDVPHRIAYGALICGLATDGVWAKLDTLYVFAAPSQSVALLNIRQNNPTATNNGCVFTTDVGFAGNGTSAFINTNFNPVTFLGHVQLQDSATKFAWCNTQTFSATRYLRGESANLGRDFIQMNPAASTVNQRVNTSPVGQASITGVGDFRGLWAASRNSQFEVKAYKNGVFSAVDTTNHDSLINANVVALSAFGTFMPGQILAIGDGSKLNDTEHLALYNRLHTYLQAIAGIP